MITYRIKGTTKNERCTWSNNMLYWSNAIGWVSGEKYGDFSLFTEKQKNTLNLPIGGKWVRYNTKKSK